MTVKRIVTKIATEHVDYAKGFYTDVLGLHVVMDHGWILAFAAEGSAAPQISIAGASSDDRAKLAGHSKKITRRVYDRDVLVSSSRVNEARAKFRKGE